MKTAENVKSINVCKTSCRGNEGVSKGKGQGLYQPPAAQDTTEHAVASTTATHPEDIRNR